MTKNYYAAQYKYGVNALNSPYTLHTFSSKADRDAWVAENEFDNGNYVASALAASDRDVKAAMKDYREYGYSSIVESH